MTRRACSPLLPLAWAALALGVYLSTLAPSFSWGNYPDDAMARASQPRWLLESEDSAELAGAAATLGIAHPSGYPLYVLLAHGFTRLPVGADAARRTNLFSAVCAAAAVVFLWLCVYELTGRARAASVAALLFAFSYSFWGHAIVTEVYALHLALLTLGLWLGLRAARADGWRALYLWAFAIGLGCSNRVTTVLWLPGFAWLLWPRLLAALRAGWPALRLAACFAAGLLPYLYIPLRALQQPSYNWGDASSPGRLLALVSGAEFRDGGGFQVGRLLEGLSQLPARVLVEYGLPAAALGMAGWLLAVWLSRRRASAEGLPPRALGALVLMGAVQLAFALGYWVRDPLPALIPFHLLLAIGMGIAVAWLEGRLEASGRPARLALTVCLVGLIAAPVLEEEPRVRSALARAELGLPRPLHGLLLPHPPISMRHHYMALRYARGVLEALPPDAVFLALGDGRIFGVLYEQRVQGRRPDVLSIPMGVLRHDWYRRRLAEQLGIPELSLVPADSAVGLIAAAAQAAGRPVLFNMPLALAQSRGRMSPFPVELPRVSAGDRIAGDGDLLYRLTPLSEPEPSPTGAGAKKGATTSPSTSGKTSGRNTARSGMSTRSASGAQSTMRVTIRTVGSSSRATRPDT